MRDRGAMDDERVDANSPARSGGVAARRRASAVVAAYLLASCGPHVARTSEQSGPSWPRAFLRERVEAAQMRSELPAGCDDPVTVFERGVPTSEICQAAAEVAGLTIVELGPRWRPRVLREEAPDASQPYGPTYEALADERFDELPPGVARERFLELYGIEPTFGVVVRRVDETRYACHESIDDAPLRAMEGTIVPWGPPVDAQRTRAAEVRALSTRLTREQAARGLATIDDLASDPRLAAIYARYEHLRTPVEAVSAAQSHLACDGLLSGTIDGVFDARTANALREFHRMYALFGRSLFDGTARETIPLDRREADYIVLLRVLRERVASATGLIEDGSAGRAWGTVLGRVLDANDIRAHAGQGPAPNPAPDLVSPATEHAARALGWTDAAAVRAYFDRYGAMDRVAVRLPPRPDYHAASMDIRVEIDRGDVWYDYPFRAGVRAPQPVDARPVLTLFAKRSDGTEIALVRWSTTIGGWKAEVGPSGAIGWRYKESPVGPRVWRDLIAAPAWLPPPSTPESDLRAGPRARRDLLGPGHHSAYGLVMAVHHDIEGDSFADEGVRTHGSASFRSILTGESHGCHRLHNHLALRLGSFLLAHRPHVVRGDLPASYARSIRLPSGTETLRVRSRGYLFELVPPVPVEVLPGRIRGARRTADRAFRARPSAGPD